MNGQKVSGSHVLRNGDRVGHLLHRHEPPVSAEPIVVLHDANNLLVVNKPGSMPVQRVQSASWGRVRLTPRSS